jgi:hypothetical protein
VLSVALGLCVAGSTPGSQKGQTIAGRGLFAVVVAKQWQCREGQRGAAARALPALWLYTHKVPLQRHALRLGSYRPSTSCLNRQGRSHIVAAWQAGRQAEPHFGMRHGVSHKPEEPAAPGVP